MKNKLFLITIICSVISLSSLAQDKKSGVIDFEEHLSDTHISKINELINESGVNISIVFFNVNEILGYKLEEPRKVSDYIKLWEQNKKDEVLVLFSNIDLEFNYWSENLKIKSTISNLDNPKIEKIIENTKSYLADTKYEIIDEKKQQDYFFDAIVQIISLIANDVNMVIEIKQVGNPEDEGFCAGVGAWKASYGKNDEAEVMEFKYSINPLFSKSTKLKIYTKQGELFFEQVIESGEDKSGSWDGHKTPIKDGEKEFISLEQSPFKVVIEAKKSENSKLVYKAFGEYEVHERAPDWLVLHNMDAAHTITRNVELLGDMPEKNRFRRYLTLEELYYKKYENYGLNLKEKKITPLKYMANNFEINSSFYNKSLPFHKGFAKIIGDIKFTGKYKSIWSLSIRIIRDAKVPQISEHGTGTAFDIDPDKNGMLDPMEYWLYLRKLTWLDKWGKIPTPQQLFDASNIFEKVCELRKKNRNINVDEMMKQLSDAAMLIQNKNLKISVFIDKFMNETGNNELYTKFHEILTRSIKINKKRRNGTLLSEVDKNEEFLLLSESLDLIGKIEDYKNIINPYIDLYFFEERELPTPVNNEIYYHFGQDLKKVTEHLENMAESLHKIRSILAVHIDNPENIPIPEISLAFAIEKLSFNADNEFKERLVFFKEFDNHNHLALANLLKNHIGVSYSYIRKSFMYGFCNIKPEDAEKWIAKKELRWGAYKKRLDCMHFEIHPHNYAKEFYKIYNK